MGRLGGLLGLTALAHAAGVVLSPAYFPTDSPDPVGDAVAALALTGLANRAGPAVWLNGSAPSWERVPVMWPNPEADPAWISYLGRSKHLRFDRAPDAALCTLLSLTEPGLVKGVVIYDRSDRVEALQWLAVTAAGLLDGLPVAADSLGRWECLKRLPVLLRLPGPGQFADNLAAYSWAAERLLPRTSRRVMVGVCRSWANYSCGWSDPLGLATVDFAVQQRAMVVNLAPDRPEQAAMFRRVAAHLQPFGVFAGWAEPESSMVALLSQSNLVVQCGAPNLSFFAALKVSVSRLGQPRQPPILNTSKVYLAFQSNEGDTPKNAYSFRGGNWLNPARGKVAISWGVAPVIADLFPGLWEYYATTATPTDQFFAATGGVGYTYPWGLNHSAFFAELDRLFDTYMPPDHRWVDLWEGGCPGNSSENPCLPLYAAMGAASKMGGFSQQPTTQRNSAEPNWVLNDWLPSGIPLVLPPSSLWYPQAKGICNSSESLPDELDCIERRVRAVAATNPQRPLFVLAYGCDRYVDVALAMQERLEFAEIVGVQDLTVLASRQTIAAAPN